MPDRDVRRVLKGVLSLPTEIRVLMKASLANDTRGLGKWILAPLYEVTVFDASFNTILLCHILSYYIIYPM